MMKSQKSANSGYNYRSSVTGKYIKPADAKKSPSKTEKEKRTGKK